jgi:anti-sigma regulatory factor (Ser/Thr protein kinase)
VTPGVVEARGVGAGSTDCTRRRDGKSHIPGSDVQALTGWGALYVTNRDPPNVVLDVIARAASRRDSDHLPGIGPRQQGTTPNVISNMEGATPGDEPETSERYDLPDDASAAGMARVKARRFVGRVRMEAVVEPLTLIVSELVSNAVRHGKPPIQLLLQRVGRGVRVDVHDEAPEAGPANDLDGPATLPGPYAEGGRGRFLVDALSSRHGVMEIPDDGKEVWAVIEPDRSQDRAAETESPEDSRDAAR